MTDYLRRGVFRSCSEKPAGAGILAYRITWHRDRVFDLRVDTVRQSVSIPCVLPGASKDLHAGFRTFVQQHHDPDLPEHRRIDPARARARVARRRGRVALTLEVMNGDYAYALQRLIHLVHETYVIFLADAAWREYKIAQLGDDPDWG